MHPRIQHLINHPFEVQLNDVALLQDQIDLYPYFPTLRALLLFGLKEFDHPSYQEELKKTSIYSPSRVALYHYLQKNRQESTQNFDQELTTKSNKLTIDISDKIEDEIIYLNDENTVEWVEEFDELDEFDNINTENVELSENSTQETSTEFSEKEFDQVKFETEKIKAVPTQDLNEFKTEQNTEFDTTPALTFNEWLKSAKPKSEQNQPKATEEPTTNSPTEKDIKFQLINDFIEKSPKISPVKNQESAPIIIKNDPQIEYSDLMTETLAQIYTEQKKYDKAIRAYKILMLKYPDKSDFFADKIEEIKFIRDHK